MLGYWSFGSRYLDIVPYMDGQLWTANNIPEGIAWQAADDDMLHVIPTAAGTDVLQKRFSDAYASDLSLRWHFSFKVQAFDEEEHFRLHRALNRGTAFYFVPGIWLEEVFSDCINGSVRALTRPLAEDIHPDVTSGTHPVVFYKDDAVDSDCAAISGTPKQTVTVAENGDIAVRYLPAFRCVGKAVGEALETLNSLQTTVQLHEVVRRP